VDSSLSEGSSSREHCDGCLGGWSG
jgi:hypothetical protein